MAEGKKADRKKANGKNSRWKKTPKEKMKNNNNMKSREPNMAACGMDVFARAPRKKRIWEN